MSKRFLKTVIMLMVLGLSSAFAPLVLANQAGITAGFQSTQGAKLGVFYAVDLGETLQLQPGVYYSLRNYKVPPPDWFDLMNKKVYDMVRFIEIPVLLKYKINLKGPFQPFFLGGGYIAFRISEQSIFDTNFSGSFRQYADVDGGVVFGAGFGHGRGRIKLHLDFRVNIGLTWIQKVEIGMLLSSIMPTPPIESKNRSLSILVGVSF
jgi:hypothetical protein